MTTRRTENSEWDFPNASTPLGSAAYYAVRFSPEPQRRRNALLFAWYQLVQAVAENPRDPGAARLKLDWWRQELDNIPGEKARHPLAIELQRTKLGETAASIMGAIIDTADEEIRNAWLGDYDAFTAACRGSLGNLFLVLAELENEPQYKPEDCLGFGGYCAAVERIRHLTRFPQRVPKNLDPQRLQQIDRTQRTALIEELMNRFPGTRAPEMRQIPDFSRRLTALSRAMHSKMHSQGYTITDTLSDRAPIAQLWTAWRCR